MTDQPAGENRMLVRALLIVSLIAAASNSSFADSSSAYLPLTNQQRLTSNGSIGGSAGCETNGSYDATTLAWRQFGDCDGTIFIVDGANLSEDVVVTATLDALVDNAGEAIGGAFILRGIIPEVGINDEQILAAGVLIDAFSGLTLGGYNVLALIELDYSNPALGDLGSLLFWEANNDIVSWNMNNSHWQTTVTEYGSNFTGSQYWFHNREDIFAPDNDADDDSLQDNEDNCITASNTGQSDADGDGIGTACDADLNNDCAVNFVYLGLFRKAILSDDPNADFNGDGVVNAADLGQLRLRFFQSPGPSGIPNVCD